MKKFLKRSLIVMVIVLSMIAALCMVASAEEVPTGTVASVTKNGTTTDYTDFDSLYDAINRVNGVIEVTLYQDATWNRAVVILDTLIVKAADGVTPTLTIEPTSPSKNNGADSTPYQSGFVFASASKKLEFKNINIDVKQSTIVDATKGGTSLLMLNSTTEATVWAGHSEVVFDNVNVTSAGAVINQYGTGEFTNCYVTVNGGSVVATGDFIEGSRSGRAEKFAFNLSVTGGASFDVANLYSTLEEDSYGYITYATDEAAKEATMGYRVGDTVGGKPGEVYFKIAEEAFAVAAAGVKVYDITGNAPVEAVKPCEHTFTDEVVAPTCTEEG